MTDATRLTFETTIDTRYAHMELGLASGLSVSLGNSLRTLYDVIDYVPAGTMAFMNMKTKRRQLLYNCVDGKFDQGKH